MSRYLIIPLIPILLSAGARSAEDSGPVHWTYSAIRKDKTLYEVHLSAHLQSGWHIYAQKQPADAMSIPTTIKFDDNEVVALTGPTQEIGRKLTEKDPTLGIAQYEYETTVDFVQLAQLKQAGASATLTGMVKYQVCNGKECLQPETIDFEVRLQPDQPAGK